MGAQPGADGVPLRPPVPPQRHDCPQLSVDSQLRLYGGVAAYGGEGTCRGVSARSGWRVRTVQ
ncbi:hypothetical protein ACH5AJ_34420, partial [Streptomyces rochei]|uniref:hypothetical protein n=1 Tax=Streptomyces rochei TaxID=1928 RepID=UPI00379CF152